MSSKDETPLATDVAEALALLESLPVGSVVSLANGRVAQVGDYRGRRSGKPLEVAGERGEVDVRDIGPLRNLPLTVLRSGGEGGPVDRTGGVVVLTRDGAQHVFPDAVRWVGAREVGPFSTDDLDVIDAKGKVIATFRGQHWTGAVLRRGESA